MKSIQTNRFKKAFAKLPADVQLVAKKNYQLWMVNPFHPSLQFKQIHSKRMIFSLRIGLHYRALASLKKEGTVLWLWIGHHSEYDKFLENK